MPEGELLMSRYFRLVVWLRRQSTGVWFSRVSGLQNVYFNFTVPPVLTVKCKDENKL